MAEADGPDGLPVGRALLIPPGVVNDEFREAVATVAAVHGDGALPTVPVLLTTGLEGRGRLVHRAGVPNAILIEHGVSYRAVALVHEVGHLLDLVGIGDGASFASASSPMFADWLLSVVDTPAYARLDEIIRRALAEIPEHHLRQRTRLSILRDPEELWARSYAQYIAVRSGNLDLNRGIAALTEVSIAGLTVPLQWERDEFASIAREIDLLMRRLQWRSRRPT